MTDVEQIIKAITFSAWSIRCTIWICTILILICINRAAKVNKVKVKGMMMSSKSKRVIYHYCLLDAANNPRQTACGISAIGGNWHGSLTKKEVNCEECQSTNVFKETGERQ